MGNRLRAVYENGTEPGKTGCLQSVGKHIKGVLRAALVWGMGVQILLGMAWLIRNVAGLQNFQESSLLLAGETAADGFYSGVLYRGLVTLLSSQLWILYAMQLAAAVIAGYGLMSCLISRNQLGMRLFCALALTTIPQAMQCHLAVLPWSLGTSLLLGETALWRRVWEKLSVPESPQTLGRSGASDRQGAWEESGLQDVILTSAKIFQFLPVTCRVSGRNVTGRKENLTTRQYRQDMARKAVRKPVAAMLLGWVLILLVLPIYAWFALPLLLALLWRMGKGRKGLKSLACGLAALALFLCSVTVNCGWNPAGWNRRLAADALSRTGWPYFQYTYEVFPQPLHDEIGLVTAREVSAYADGVDQVLIPKLEEMYGAEETTALLWQLAEICLRDNLKADVKNLVWDMAAYHATPPILAMQLKGRAYDAYSGVNYEQMRSRAPLLTRYYVAYGGRWWWAMLALAAGIWVCGQLSGAGARGRLSEQPPGAGGEPAERMSEEKAGREPKGKVLWNRVKIFLQCWFPVLAGMEWMILNFVLSGSGIMDYKKTIWVTILWYVGALWPLAGGEGSREWQS